MRLKPDLISIIKEVAKTIDDSSQVYLFGSRVDDQKKGGDIDLMIVSPEKWKIDKQIKFEARLFSLLDEQKIDVVYYQTNEKNTFRSIIEKESVLL